jgi:tripartite-type tricarboxylate transporter receptor subunit TctC
MKLVRWLLALGAAAFAAVAVPLAGYGQAYPTRPIRLVVPWPAGGVADLRARVIAQRLGKALGQQVVVDNRPGASAVLGAHLVSRAAPDGYTLLFGSFIDQGTVLSLMRDLPYDPDRDFAYIAPTGRTCLILVAHKSLGVSSVDNLVALLKGRPGQLDYASAGIGTPQHILMEQFKRAARVDVVPVQYKGGAPAVQDLVAGHVPLMFEYAATIAGYVRSETLIPLMTACAHRVTIFPAVPSATEAGYSDVGVTTWGGILAPAATPASVVALLNREINKILASPDVRGHTAFAGAELDIWTPEEFAQYARKERPRWAQIVKAAGIEPQ